MSTKDFTANVISATKVVPDGNFKDSKASGIWDINEALDLIKGGNWPNVANINPAAFVGALFSVDLWDGSGSSRSITNGINLSDSGGLVWYKGRDTGGQGAAQRHSLYDTERGVTKRLISSENHAEATESTALTAFNSNGFTIGGDAETNQSNYDYVSWTFREQPKFFDIVKYEGTGSDRTVAHSLGTTVGMIIIKNIDQTDNWAVYHREAYDQNAGADYVLHLNTTDARTNSSDYFNDTAPTSSVFTVGTDHTVNADGENYVAYLFAHHDDDGGFGAAGDQDIIKCGSYTGNGNATGTVVNLGFEPQWLLVRRANSGDAWHIVDNMRGFTADGVIASNLRPNNNDVEGSATRVKPTSTGFQLVTTDNEFNANGGTYIFMAIRRGEMQTPTAASDVFSATGWTGNNTANRFIDNSILTDMVWTKGRSAATGSAILDRLRGQGNILQSEGAGAEFADNGVVTGFDFNTGFEIQTHSSINDNNATYISHAWARARGFFDVVAYTGNGQNGQQIKHNLGVAPELTFIKNRGTVDNWLTLFYAGELANNEGWQSTQAFEDASSFMSSTFPNQATYFGASANSNAGASNNNYIAYLFATVANVSKVGSFTQSGATNVACGFTGSTPALIILKRTDSTGNWFTFDSTRGIVAGNDKSLYMNTAGAEVTDADVVDPYSGGFATTSSLTDGDYIFYAIAATS